MEDEDWSLLTRCVVGAVLGGLVPYHLVAAYYHVKYYVRRREDAAAWKCQPKRFLTTKQLRSAALAGSANLALGGVASGLLVYAVKRGAVQVPLYWDLTTHGLAYTLVSTVGYFVVADFFAYVVHRLVHLRPLFLHVHRYHHKYVATSPYVATAVHPAELLAQQAMAFLPIFVVPLHGAGVIAVLVYILVFNVIDHSGVKLHSSMPWQGPTTYHDDHHVHFHVNFGQHLMIWDRIFGTLRREGRRYGEDVYGGRGTPDGDASSPAPYVDYGR